MLFEIHNGQREITPILPKFMFTGIISLGGFCSIFFAKKKKKFSERNNCKSSRQQTHQTHKKERLIWES